LVSLVTYSQYKAFIAAFNAAVEACTEYADSTKVPTLSDFTSTVSVPDLYTVPGTDIPLPFLGVQPTDCSNVVATEDAEFYEIVRSPDTAPVPYSFQFTTPESWDSDYIDIPLVDLVVIAATPVCTIFNALIDRTYSRTVKEMRIYLTQNGVKGAARMNKAQCIQAIANL
jgi:hypothetical protein